MKHKIKFILSVALLNAIGNNLFAQTPATCPCSSGGPNLCATTAQELYNALYSPTPTAGQIIEICGTINLGEIDPSKFPFRIPDYVTLRGNYNLIDGTVIKFPYLYKKSYQCGIQNHTIAPPDDGEDFSGGGNTTNTSTGDLQAFAFTLGNGSHFEYIRLEGPKTDTKEESQFFPLLADQNANGTCVVSPASLLAAKQGLTSGLLPYFQSLPPLRGDFETIEDVKLFFYSKQKTQHSLKKTSLRGTKQSVRAETQ
jgi:hypothetical protein